MSDTTKRVIWTWIQVFVVAFPVFASGFSKLPNFHTDTAAWLAALVSLLVAAASAVKNVVFPPGHKAR